MREGGERERAREREREGGRAAEDTNDDERGKKAVINYAIQHAPTARYMCGRLPVDQGTEVG